MDEEARHLSFARPFVKKEMPTLGRYRRADSELFPTGLRALGSSAAGAFKVLGQCAGFVVAGVLIAQSSLPRAVAILAVGPAVGVVLVVLLLPETRGRDLDEIAVSLAAPSPVLELGNEATASGGRRGR